MIGVIALLAGILLPTITYARKSARRTRIAADLNSISVALEAYKADHGDYPRLPAAGYSGSETPKPGQAPNVFGAQLLSWALLSPARDMPTADTNKDDGDGAEGFGFRIRRPAGRPSVTPAVGQVYGPYLKPSDFHISTNPDGTPLTNANEAMVLDSLGGPVLYYPAHPRPAQANVNVDHGYVWKYPNASTPAATLSPLFNSTHNDETNLVSLAQLQSRLGADATGKVDTTKGKQAQTLPYLLWSAGLDGKFGGPDEDLGADDVTNIVP
jgi:type II secretory pathway pseudopilin PulG